MTRAWPESTAVLLAEDDRLTANLIRTRLEMEGLTVHCVSNGIEALALLEMTPVDLVVTDLLMPAMNGFRLIQEIRQMPGPQGKVPIFVISVMQTEAEIISCFSAGADYFMSKPLIIPLMLERLWRLFKRGPALE